MPTFLYPLLSRSNGLSRAGAGATDLSAPLSFSRASKFDSVTSIGATSLATSFTTQMRANYATVIGQFASASGPFVEFVSKPLETFTLSGNVRVRAYARENAAANNNTYGFALLKLDTAGALSAIARTTATYEILTTVGGNSGHWTTAASTSTLFNNGDRLVLRLFATNLGTSTASTGSSIYINASGPDVSGDTFLEIQENISVFDKFKFIVS